MKLDFATLDSLRTHHPAWRLLRSDHAPLIASFLHRVFVAPNVRLMEAADLAEALDDELYALRQQYGDALFPKPALEDLNDWAGAEKGWLRKFYRQGSDEPQFDLTPSTEKAIASSRPSTSASMSVAVTPACCSASSCRCFETPPARSVSRSVTVIRRAPARNHADYRLMCPLFG